MASISTLVDRVKIFTLSSGTGPFQLGAAAPAYRGVAALIDGAQYSYAVEYGSLFEVGTGVYNLATGTLVRSPQLSSSGGGAISFPAGVSIAFTELAVDLTPAGSLPIVQAEGAATNVAMSQNATTVSLDGIRTTIGGLVPAVDLASSAPGDGAALVGYSPLGDYASGTVGRALIARVTLAELVDLPVAAGRQVYLTDAFRAGFFVCRAGSPPVTDTLKGVYVQSSLGSFYWERVRTGKYAYPEWWGAEVGNGSFDSYPACQACLDVTGTLVFSPGVYYGSQGLVLPSGAVVRGAGALISAYSIDDPTDHIMAQAGVASVSYASGADLEGFALARSVTPTTPASSTDDILQGHGLHFFMVSNPRVRHVYTYNNLVECYINNCLSSDLHDVRGIRQTGGGGDRWYGEWVDGATTGGTFGGPSPNPSTTITKPNMVALAAVGQSYNYYANGAIQDLWFVDPEAAGGHKQFFLDINGAAAGDVHIVRPICDAYVTNAIHVLGAPLGSSIDITEAWVAPASGATSHGVHIDASHGVTLSGRGDFALASGLRAVSANDCTELDCNFRTVDSQNPFVGTSVISSGVIIKAHKRFAGGGGAAGEIITLIGGSRNSAKASGTISTAGSPQLWNAGVALDGTAANCTIDVTGVGDGAATARFTIATVAVTTQGDVSGHVVINPGAGPML